ncbi:hypothetical protein [Streptomyces sp. NPDC058268]|uniref:hypothetical protein n=1 Tax=Streptomyces sp. NPDC058268 TaxID=3346413 RepID=UPI0036E47365
MNREERRRAARQGRRANGGGDAWQPPQGRVRRAAVFATADEDRQVQDFTAGTIFADGAAMLVPDGDTSLGPVFVLFVPDDEHTYGPAPQLREAFTLLDKHGSEKLHKLMPVGTSWSGISARDPLIKLKLVFPGPRPAPGTAEVLLRADLYASMWHHVAGGGVIGVTTAKRLQAATSRPDASFADGMEACILLGIHSSPVLEQFIGLYGWPRS